MKHRSAHSHVPLPRHLLRTANQGEYLFRARAEVAAILWRRRERERFFKKREGERVINYGSE